MGLSERKKRILRAIVETYIATAEPVGSKVVAEKAGLEVSTATIRNEMADLTELGYLEQPHTSAGRVPSAAGYRLYVNELMDRQQLTLQETERINAALKEKGKAPLTIGEGADVDGGFLLRGKGYEMNCSFEAMLSDFRQAEESGVAKILFV